MNTKPPQLSESAVRFLQAQNWTPAQIARLTPQELAEIAQGKLTPEAFDGNTAAEAKGEAEKKAAPTDARKRNFNGDWRRAAAEAGALGRRQLLEMVDQSAIGDCILSEEFFGKRFGALPDGSAKALWSPLFELEYLACSIVLDRLVAAVRAGDFSLADVLPDCSANLVAAATQARVNGDCDAVAARSIDDTLCFARISFGGRASRVLPAKFSDSFEQMDAAGLTGPEKSSLWEAWAAAVLLKHAFATAISEIASVPREALQRLISAKTLHWSLRDEERLVHGFAPSVDYFQTAWQLWVAANRSGRPDASYWGRELQRTVLRPLVVAQLGGVLGPEHPGWDPDKVMMRFADVQFHLEDYYKQIFILGSIGSGKTHTVIPAFIDPILEVGCGGLVLCDKADEGSNFVKRATAVGREGDILHIKPHKEDSEAPFRTNVLEEERRRPWHEGGGTKASIVELLLGAAEVADRNLQSGGGDSQSAQFFENSVRSLLGHALTIIRYSQESLTLDLWWNVVNSSPSSPAEAQKYASLDFTPVDERDAFGHCLARARRNMQGAPAKLKQVLNHAERSFLKTLADLGTGNGAATRATIMQTLETTVGVCMEYPIKDLFFSDTNYSFTDTYRKGSLIVFDFPVEQWKLGGQMAAAIAKHAVQAACKTRWDNPDGKARPVIIFADEYPKFMTSNDATAIETARSQRLGMIVAAQTISGIRAEMGNEDRVNKLVDLYKTKAILQNEGDSAKWAAGLFGETMQFNATLQKRHTEISWSPWMILQGDIKNAVKWEKKNEVITGGSWDIRPDIQPNEIMGLTIPVKSEGVGYSEAILYIGGRKFAPPTDEYEAKRWPEGRPWIKWRFPYRAAGSKANNIEPKPVRPSLWARLMTAP